MIKIITSAALIASILVACNGSKDTATPTNNNNPTPALSAKIGTAFGNNDYSASIFSAKDTLGKTTITAFDANGVKLVLTFQPAQPGTYQLTGSKTSGITATYTLNGNSLSDKSGSIVVGKYDKSTKKCSGTFNFVTQPNSGFSATVSDGVFTDVPIQ